MYRVFEVGEYKYANKNFKGTKGVATATKFTQNENKKANTNMLIKILKEQREFPQQPNLHKMKTKKHRFQFSTRYTDTFSYMIGHSWLWNSNMLSQFHREQRALTWQPKVRQKCQNCRNFSSV